MVPFVLCSARYHQEEEWSGLASLKACFLERAVLQMSIGGQKTALDPPTHLKNGDPCQILNRFQIGKAPEANKMYLC